MKNNRGFMLVEVIVTSTIIVTALVGFYASFSRLYKNYSEKEHYYNIDAIYATREMIDSIFDQDVGKFINDIFHSGTSKYLVKNGSCTDNSIYLCSEIVPFYKIENMIVVEYDKTSLQGVSITNQTFKEYRDYVINYYDITTNKEYSYLFLTEIHDGNNYYYANLRVR